MYWVLSNQTQKRENRDGGNQEEYEGGGEYTKFHFLFFLTRFLRRDRHDATWHANEREESKPIDGSDPSLLLFHFTLFFCLRIELTATTTTQLTKRHEQTREEAKSVRLPYFILLWDEVGMKRKRSPTHTHTLQILYKGWEWVRANEREPNRTDGTKNGYATIWIELVSSIIWSVDSCREDIQEKKKKKKRMRIRRRREKSLEWCRCAGGVIESSRSSITLVPLSNMWTRKRIKKMGVREKKKQPKKICSSFFSR